MTADRNRYLLISRVGRDSLHGAWLNPGADRKFDVLLSAYDPAVIDPCLPGVFYEHRAGPKVAGYAALLRAHAELIGRYDYVALFDDDLVINHADMARLFDTAALYQLKIAQPALTHDSHFTFAALLHDSAFKLRFVNYVEMMCPVFRADALQAVLPLFEMRYESGIDLIWCNLLTTAPNDFAVIDAVSVRHTRAVGTLKAANGFGSDRRYEDDINAVLKRFGLPWLSCLPYAGVRLDGTIERRRWVFLLSALRLAHVPWDGVGWAHRARSLAVYWKHLLTRAARNQPVRLSQLNDFTPAHAHIVAKL